MCPLSTTERVARRMSARAAPAWSSSSSSSSLARVVVAPRRRARWRRQGTVVRPRATLDALDALGDVVTGVGCYYVSDAIAQRATRKTHAVTRGDSCALPDDGTFARDDARRVRYCIFGAFDGATSYAWYEFVDGAVPADASRSETATTLLKVAFDAVCYNPLWAAAFIVIMALLSNRGIAGAREDLKSDWRDLYLNNVLVWAPLNVGIYGVVPLDYRVLAMYVCNTAYVTCLSMWNERSETLLDSGESFSLPDVVARALPDDSRADWRAVTGCPRCEDARIVPCASCAEGVSNPVVLIDVDGRTRTTVPCAECMGTQRVSCPECTKVVVDAGATVQEVASR